MRRLRACVAAAVVTCAAHRLLFAPDSPRPPPSASSGCAPFVGAGAAPHCLELRFDAAVPPAHVARACRGCAAHPCHFRTLMRWASARPARPSGFEAFEKVYVIHYAKRPWRKARMLRRLADAGVPTDPAAGVVAFVDAFDADELAPRELACLTARGNGTAAEWAAADALDPPADGARARRPRSLSGPRG